MVAFYRLWIGALVLTAISVAFGQPLSWKTVHSTWLGGVFLAGDMMMFFSAVRLTSIVDVTVIGGLQPALVLVFARRMFNERLARWDLFWIAVAMAGVFITVIGPGPAAPHRLLGDLLAVGTLLSFSAYWLASKRARESTPAMEYTAGVMIVAAIVTSLVVVVAGHDLLRVHATDWVWIALIALVPGTGHFLMNWAHRFVDASVSSAISCLSPFVASVAAIPILGQSLSALQVAGGIIGLAAVAVVAARSRHSDAPPPELFGSAS